MQLESYAKNVKVENERAAVEGSFDKSLHVQRLANLEYDKEVDYLSARKSWRRGVGWLLFFTVCMHIFACLVLFCIGVSDKVLGAVTISLTVEVLGLSAIILSHLFPKNKVRNQPR